MRIEYLADRPDLVTPLARLHFSQWGYLRPDESLEGRITRLVAACGRGGVPSVLVGLEDGALAGSAMLVAHDMDARPDLTPWLAGLFVVPELRGRGLGAVLAAGVEDLARAAGIERLHLYTFDLQAYYARSGWTPIEHARYLGHEVTIMVKLLG